MICKLMWWLTISTAAILPVATQASSWLNCEVLAKVEEVRTKSATNGTSLQEVKIRLLRNPYSCEGHGIPKKYSNGQTLWVEIASEEASAKITPGMELKFRHEVYQGMGPQGLVKSDEWSFLEIVR